MCFERCRSRKRWTSGEGKSIVYVLDIVCPGTAILLLLHNTDIVKCVLFYLPTSHKRTTCIRDTTRSSILAYILDRQRHIVQLLMDNSGSILLLMMLKRDDRALVIRGTPLT